MSALKIVETPYCSLLQGELPTGCKSCVRGEKLVLFVTGICPATCFFCPLSPEKKMKDTVWANEQELTGSQDEQIQQLIIEAKANKATGAGVTGGDPLARLDRTCAFIKALKREFGKGFHIHLYTPLILVNEITMKRLYDAGLDEIRFHPSLSSEKFWDRMKIAKEYDWNIGLEIPIFPDKVSITKRLIEYIVENKIGNFLNLNELEISELTIDTFERHGYEIIGKHSYAIKGSKEAAIEIMKFARDFAKQLSIHFCTTTLKDRVQMGNRIIRRAENVSQRFDMVDDEGILTRGAVYINYTPSFGYNKRMKALTNPERATEEKSLIEIFSWLRAQGMPLDAGIIDAYRLRIVLNAEALSKLSGKLKKKFPGSHCAIIREWPTSDSFLVEIDEL